MPIIYPRSSEFDDGPPAKAPVDIRADEADTEAVKQGRDSIHKNVLSVLSVEAGPVGAKEKLANLERYLPGEQSLVYEVARFISTRMNDTMEPPAFDLVVLASLRELETGRDGWTGKPLTEPYHALKLTPEFYSMLQYTFTSRVKGVIFGEEYSGPII